MKSDLGASKSMLQQLMGWTLHGYEILCLGLRASMQAVPDVEWIVQRNEETRPLWEGLVGDSSVTPPNNMRFFMMRQWA